MADRAAKAELFEQYARVGKALSAPKRLELLDLLAQGERTVDALARAAGAGVSTTSMHLQALRQAGLVRTRRDGIPGAVSIPGEELEQRLAELPADVLVVAYCRGAYCVLAYDAVRLLTLHGLSARRLREAMLEWRLAGMPVQSDVA